MDPNSCWDEILIDISLLHDCTVDKAYAARVIWAMGESEEDIRTRLSNSLLNLGEWVANGGAPPKPI